MLSRRDMLKGSLAAAAIGATASTVFIPLRAAAKAPVVGTQAPGYYRLMVGDVEVTALSDGTGQFPLADLYLNTSPEHARTALANAFQGTPTSTSVNAYLLNFGDRLVLLDAGTSDLLGPELGKLPANIIASGYHPDQIDDVVITHIHTDHSGGLIMNGKKVFPNATAHVPKLDAEYWLSTENRDKAPESAKQYFDQAVLSTKLYSESGTLSTYEANASPVPGLINSTHRPGHTPGHSALWFESKGEKFVYWGDITHGDVIQFDEPGVSIAFDVDPDQAITTREAAFAEAVSEKYLVAGCHIAFPGIGHVIEDSTMFDWVPMNYRADV
ncbi:MBL fold metallo-hydrolase [Thalassospira xianhensis]|uniref:Beta-lactamase n=1 Tax=Thalassospira xianhensis MCCC 1A02616 TaxID=1177929 RepID=A0A367U9Q8_9PROT|nr:MBL fold metallo-hydrolase [Thalassospira xianhensis]RCK04690.1 beta-lactamase [Thalassospira xianhensis MCCC 1A02616]